ncbi:MAG: hypothetical protein CVU44_11000 [Chloroflexi bacterium HGW-Chloroflexi-6]|nr:MAG: hypothetical protein CVU44_11000 [Chloroflexi bacterium HGW-Chloroflexi-6]
MGFSVGWDFWNKSSNFTTQAGDGFLKSYPVCRILAKKKQGRESLQAFALKNKAVFSFLVD